MKDIRNIVAKVLETEATYVKAQQSEDYQIIDGLIKSAVLDHIGDDDRYYYSGWYVENGKFYGRISKCYQGYWDEEPDSSIEVDVTKVNASQGDGWKLITADTEYDDEDERLEAIARHEEALYHAEKREAESLKQFYTEEDWERIVRGQQLL